MYLFVFLVLEHCSLISEADFALWAEVYRKNKLSDLKKIEHWRFAPEVVDKFFNISLSGNYKNCYYTENVDIWDEHDDVDVNKFEKQYLCANEAFVTTDSLLKPAKGLESVISKLQAQFDTVPIEAQTFRNGKLSELMQKGIFLRSTVAQLADEIIAKSDILSSFKICIIGIHCVVSVGRMILEFENISLSTKFSFLIIDYSNKKIEDLKALLAQSNPEIKTKVKYVVENFLIVDNHSFQTQNLVLCFLNASITRIFALKFILLQCYCSTNSTGLQKVLCSQRVSYQQIVYFYFVF